MIAYLNGAFKEESELSISLYERGFLFADGAYEVARYYHHDYFQLETHLQRLKRSLTELRIQIPDLNVIREAVYRLCRENELSGKQHIAYIQVTRGSHAPRRHYFPSDTVKPTVYITHSEFATPQKQIDQGAQVILTEDIRWARCDIKSIALLPNVLARQEAIDRGATEAIFVRDRFIMEGTHTNFCAVKNGTLITPPLTNFILGGITRAIVLDICRDLNIPWREEPIPGDDLSRLDEAMIVGTTTDVTPVIQVDEVLIGSGPPGPLTRKIQQAFFKLTAAS